MKNTLQTPRQTALGPLAGALAAVTVWGAVILWLLMTSNPPTRLFVNYLPKDIVEFLGHVGAFSGFVVTLCGIALALGQRGAELIKSAAAAFAIGCVCGASIELMQAMGVARTAEWIDGIANVVGSAIGAALVVLLVRRIPYLARPKQPLER